MIWAFSAARCDQIIQSDPGEALVQLDVVGADIMRHSTLLGPGAMKIAARTWGSRRTTPNLAKHRRKDT
jgi:hypothetical protein